MCALIQKIRQALLDNTFIIYVYLLLISIRMLLHAVLSQLYLLAKEKYHSMTILVSNISAYHLRIFLCLIHFLLSFTTYSKE